MKISISKQFNNIILIHPVFNIKYDSFYFMSKIEQLVTTRITSSFAPLRFYYFTIKSNKEIHLALEIYYLFWVFHNLTYDCCLFHVKIGKVVAKGITLKFAPFFFCYFTIKTNIVIHLALEIYYFFVCFAKLDL